MAKKIAIDPAKGYRVLTPKVEKKWSGPGDRSWPSSEICPRTIDVGASIERCNKAYRDDGIITDYSTSNRAPASGPKTPNARYSSKPVTRRAGGVNS